MAFDLQRYREELRAHCEELLKHHVGERLDAEAMMRMQREVSALCAVKHPDWNVSVRLDPRDPSNVLVDVTLPG